MHKPGGALGPLGVCVLRIPSCHALGSTYDLTAPVDWETVTVQVQSAWLVYSLSCAHGTRLLTGHIGRSSHTLRGGPTLP